MSKEKTLQGCWLRIIIFKTLEADVFIQFSPVNTIETKCVLAALFVISLS